MSEAQAIIDRLGLLPHPEGGWYRETWRAETADGARASATAIYFLLEAGQREAITPSAALPRELLMPRATAEA